MRFRQGFVVSVGCVPFQEPFARCGIGLFLLQSHHRITHPKTRLQVSHLYDRTLGQCGNHICVQGYRNLIGFCSLFARIDNVNLFVI